jgi:3-hydroxybutyryl-CoA dehydratase
MANQPWESLGVGDELLGAVRVVTPERLVWYGDGLMTAASGVRTQAGSNIHTDEIYAREQGLPQPIADGMVATNWIASMLLDHFGEAYVTSGELRTKFIKPTFVGTKVRVKGRVRQREALTNGTIRYDLDVWTEDATGVKLTDGDARVTIGDSSADD